MAYPEDVTPSVHLAPDERDLEASPADAFEQAIPVEPGDDETPYLPSDIEAPDWDAYEQSRVVQLEDEYR